MLFFPLPKLILISFLASYYTFLINSSFFLSQSYYIHPTRYLHLYIYIHIKEKIIYNNLELSIKRDLFDCSLQNQNGGYFLVGYGHGWTKWIWILYNSWTSYSRNWCKQPHCNYHRFFLIHLVCLNMKMMWYISFLTPRIYEF